MKLLLICLAAAAQGEATVTVGTDAGAIRDEIIATVEANAAELPPSAKECWDKADQQVRPTLSSGKRLS